MYVHMDIVTYRPTWPRGVDLVKIKNGTCHVTHTDPWLSQDAWLSDYLVMHFS